MKFLLITAALVAVAFASPIYITPDNTGPAPVIEDYHPISVGPAIVEDGHEEISVGPAIVEDEHEDISVGPAIVNEAPAKPLVQIILNINDQEHVIDVPQVSEVIPDPVIIVDDAELDSVVRPEPALPEIFPEPVNIPGELN